MSSSFLITSTKWPHVWFLFADGLVLELYLWMVLLSCIKELFVETCVKTLSLQLYIEVNDVYDSLERDKDVKVDVVDELLASIDGNTWSCPFCSWKSNKGLTDFPTREYFNLVAMLLLLLRLACFDEERFDFERFGKELFDRELCGLIKAGLPFSLNEDP